MWRKKKASHKMSEKKDGLTTHQACNQNKIMAKILINNKTRANNIKIYESDTAINNK